MIVQLVAIADLGTVAINDGFSLSCPVGQSTNYKENEVSGQAPLNRGS